MTERTAGIVLAGGRSTRMGAPKATLDWHGSTLLHRVSGLLARAVDGPVVVVRAAGQDLPPLPARIELADDEREGRGPLQGIAAGLHQLGDRAQVVFVTGVDAPLLHPALVACVLRALGPRDDVALPHAHGFDQPLAAAYRTSIAPVLRELVAADRLAAGALLARLRVRTLTEHDLLADPAVAAVDPGLNSLANLNEPAEYEAARARPAPSIAIRTPARPRPQNVRAATLAAAAAAGGVALGPRIAVTLEGHGTISHPEEPLVAGDVLTFAGVA